MERNSKATDVRQTSFEDGYFAKSLGNIAYDPEYALTELVANAWDAGATKVELTIPERNNEEICISDNGIGLTTEEFQNRWMMLGYNRITHQGRKVVFPPSEEIHSRYAYGRNGIGRHAMLCFADEYIVSTKHKDTLYSIQNKAFKWSKSIRDCIQRSKDRKRLWHYYQSKSY